MKNIVSVRTNTYKKYDLKQTLAGIKKAGFKYVEISGTPGNSQGISRCESFETLCEAKKLFEEYDLTPICVSGRTEIMDTDKLEDFANNIRLAKFFGCKYLNTGVGFGKYTNKQLKKQLDKIVPYLEEYGVTAVLETHSNYASGKALAHVCELANSDKVRINYDTANPITYCGFENDELLEDIKGCVKYIGFMHLKDKLGDKKEWNYPAIGKGYVPHDKIYEILKKNKKNIPLSIEIEYTKEGSKDIKEANKAVLDSAKYLKSLGIEL